MFKFVAFFALIALVAAKPSHLAAHTVVEQAQIGAVVHSVPSAVSSQHLTQVHHSAVVSPIIAPVVKTIHAAPVVHAAPLVHAAPAVHSLPLLHSAPLLHTSIHSAPVLHSASVLHAAPLVHSAPLVHAGLHGASW